MNNNIIRRPWREGQRLYGPIRSGQVWKKRDSGKIGVIRNKCKGTFWDLDIGTNIHKTDMRDLYRFHDKIA